MDEQQTCALQMALQGHSFVLSGQAGCGKTWTISRIVQELRQNGKHVEISATTG